MEDHPPLSFAQHQRVLNTEELKVLERALQAAANEQRLPVLRSTEADGPNEWRLARWFIPLSIETLGGVDVLEDEVALRTDHVKFRRPRVADETAEVTLETPRQTFDVRLNRNRSGDWQISIEDELSRR
jgi:hypothetical protein